MTIGVGSLPSRIHLPDDDAQIARLARSSPDDDEPRRKADGTIDRRGLLEGKLPPSTRARMARIERGEIVAAHVIGSVRFGRGRLTTCQQCAFTCTGATDAAMASAWADHVRESRQRSGPVERRSDPSLATG